MILVPSPRYLHFTMPMEMKSEITAALNNCTTDNNMENEVKKKEKEKKDEEERRVEEEKSKQVIGDQVL